MGGVKIKQRRSLSRAAPKNQGPNHPKSGSGRYRLHRALLHRQQRRSQAWPRGRILLPWFSAWSRLGASSCWSRCSGHRQSRSRRRQSRRLRNRSLRFRRRSWWSSRRRRCRLSLLLCLPRSLIAAERKEGNAGSRCCCWRRLCCRGCRLADRCCSLLHLLRCLLARRAPTRRRR